MVDYLLGLGADVNGLASPQNGGRTALQAALENNHTAVVGRLLGRGADVNRQPSPSGWYKAFHTVVSEGRHDLIQLLLDRGVHTNGGRMSGETTLVAAVCHGDINIVRLLLKPGADDYRRG
ncbi:putative ankyrin repeat protein [Tolypocladium ophioglossoides CBS 100239]|uniref:Putative ankyrin repeat protein n=1 Tax=Tolypocladium ophioglossoides (strain CBS 100239) TaxID=1163406 RepID=A0A0L0NK32_TOLOC|nr:putative ankyrin repeat protein [Tolypocladium ophioglossoides CBS 100239]